MDYGSDLDLAFVYTKDGSTNGKKSISNIEFFTKLARRIMSLISIPNRYGRCYQIDTDLRPSGRSGTLVASLESYITYLRKQANPWDYLVLLKMRPIVGSYQFRDQIILEIDKLLENISEEKKQTFNNEFKKIHERFMKEYGKETKQAFSLKFSPGGISSIEMILRSLQLKNFKALIDHKRNTSDVIEVVARHNILPQNELTTLKEAHEFYQKVLSRLRLLSNTSQDKIDLENKHLQAAAKSLELTSKEVLFNKLKIHRESVEKILQHHQL